MQVLSQLFGELTLGVGGSLLAAGLCSMLLDDASVVQDLPIHAVTDAVCCVHCKQYASRFVIILMCIEKERNLLEKVLIAFSNFS